LVRQTDGEQGVKGWIVVAALILAPGAAIAAGNAYTDALTSEVNACVLVAVQSRPSEDVQELKMMRGQTSASSFAKLVESNDLRVSECTDIAKKNGENIYKKYVAGQASPKLKDDAKAIFIAWLTYVPWRTSRGFQIDSPVTAAYASAVATMHVDEMTP
jgi:hypothetical protein